MQLGIVSFGIGCGKVNKPGVYTKLSKYQEWMDKTITESIKNIAPLVQKKIGSHPTRWTRFNFLGFYSTLIGWWNQRTLDHKTRSSFTSSQTLYKQSRNNCILYVACTIYSIRTKIVIHFCIWKPTKKKSNTWYECVCVLDVVCACINISSSWGREVRREINNQK